MAIPKFEDFNKKVKDLFKDDYTDKILLKIKHNAPAGVAVTAETEYSCKGDKPALPSKLSLKWKHASGFALDKLQIKNNDGISTETSMTGVAPGLKFTFKGDDQMKGDLGVEYAVENMTLTGELDVVEFSNLRVSGAFGYQNLLLGGNLAYRLPGEKSTNQVGDYSVAAGYNAFPWFASVGSTNFNTVDLHLHYTYQKYGMGLIVNGNLDGRSPNVTFGGLCNCSPFTVVRAKAITTGATNNTALAASVSHNPAAGVNVVGSVETALSNLQAAKLGLQITLG